MAIQRAVTELGWPEHQIAVLSVGTCATDRRRRRALLRPTGVGYVGALRKLGGRGVVNLLMAVQEDRGLNEAAARLRPNRYLRLDRSPSEQQAKFLALDNASARSHAVLAELAEATYRDLLQQQDHNVGQLVFARAQAVKDQGHQIS